MRRNFAEVLQSGNIDIKKEFSRLYTLFYNSEENNTYSWQSLYNCINNNFARIPFRGTCLTLDDFNNEYDFKFNVDPEKITIDLLVTFCEYLTNLASHSFNLPLFYYDLNSSDIQFLLEQINMVIEKIGYTEAKNGDFTIYVIKDQAAMTVSEIVPQDLSYKIIEYNHHSLKGNIEAKKQTLLLLAKQFEASKTKLKTINKSLENNISYGLNNLNIRHNNLDSSLPKNYKPALTKMNKEKIESLYDDLYQMLLLGFLELDNIERMEKFEKAKREIESTIGK